MASRMDQGNTPEWTTEESYWRSNYQSRPYYRSGRTYEDYQPAYRYGFESAGKYRGRQWSDVESDLSRGWGTSRGQSKSTWEDVKDAVRDAWDRITGGSDRTTRTTR